MKTIIALVVVLATVASTWASGKNITDAAQGKSLRQFLQDRTWNKESESNYAAAVRDLNADGTPEAIVYLMGNEWCGSGGCTLLILSRDRNSWKIISQVPVTNLPIRVLKKKSKGWNSIAVWVQGGGIRRGYEAELSFDGNSYPENPTTPPARKAKKKSPGDVVIPSGTVGEPIFETSEGVSP